jgi:peptidyl-prolyl cis-trans isomerase D
MLQKIGDSLKGKKVLAQIILVPLVLVFAAWGAAGIVDLNFVGTQSWAAKADGAVVPLEQVNEAWREQQSQWQQRFGGEIPEAVRPSLQDKLLEQFVSSALLGKRAKDFGYRASDRQVEDYIRNEPAFQLDGKYSEDVAVSRLAQMGLSPEQFKLNLHASMQSAEVERGIQVSEFLTPGELSRLVKLEDEQREVRFATLPVEKFQAQAVVTDAAIAEYYKKNERDFMTPETVRLRYAELRLAQIAAQVDVAEADLQALYAKNRDRYVDPEKRRARHILVTIEKGDDAAAQRKAQDILDQLKGGADFAALAQKVSQDPGSATQGGDLGWSEKSAFVGPFSDAVFGMKEGELRGPVKTQFGYHVIRLDGIQGGRTRTYEEVKPELDAQYRRDRAADLFGDREEQVKRRLEQPGAELDAVAKEFGLAVGDVESFARGSGGAPLGADRGLEEVVFGDAALNLHKIGGPVGLGEDRFVIVKVLDHHKPESRPLASVRDQIVTELRKQAGTAAARTAAEAAVKRLDAGEDFDAVVKSLAATAEPARFIGRGDPAMVAQVRELAFAVPRPRAGKPVNRALSLDAGGAAFVSVTQVRAAVPDNNQALQAQRVNDASSRSGAAVVSAYVGEIRRNAKVEKNPAAFQ